MKNEFGVSSVVGVVLLLLLVVLAASVIGLTLSAATQNAVESTPNVQFIPSVDPQMLYHGGGDVLYKDRLKLYANGVDITDTVSIDSMTTWTEWRTGQAIELPDDYYVANLTIIALDTLGRDQLLYRGSGVAVTPLPTPTTTSTPTVTPTPTPTTPTPTVTPTPTPEPTPNPYYTVGSDHADGFATVGELVESLNNWSNALYGADVALTYGGNQIGFFGAVPIGREPILITEGMGTVTLITYGGTGTLTEVPFTRAPGYEGELLVISSDAELVTAGANLKLDGMGHGAAPLLSVTSSGSLDVHGHITLINNTNPAGNGGALHNEGSVYVSTGLIIYNNTANNGGGIYNIGAITLSSDNIIRDNVALEKGGGIYNAGLSGVSIKGPITNNSAKYGGGIYNDGTMTTTGTISGNSASISGGGVYNAGTYTFSWTSTVSDNQAQYGGGIYNEGTIPFFGGAISGNTATINGGGLFNSGSYTMGGNSIAGNTAGNIGNQVYATIDSTNSIPTWIITLKKHGNSYYYAD
ncbi:hypothetical protein Mlab_1468 [Methanocorpusculum labreanum Z]|uniref:Archaeal Type IV pilin N-terminal domain-containing protein n=1 Tax=Methanocorpusculum labreanum (strain ATCC 43576 / DSM 4855 / Z) TaxID=410358 RepID=A2STH7_METLZ|nr:type IV pilin [Methanocorpusculum labreanum]ABN07633.1 hypothetical protein Mlab_1468 [Methanocorpusculum labreanum Z]